MKELHEGDPRLTFAYKKKIFEDTTYHHIIKTTLFVEWKAKTLI